MQERARSSLKKAFIAYRYEGNDDNISSEITIKQQILMIKNSHGSYRQLCSNLMFSVFRPNYEKSVISYDHWFVIRGQIDTISGDPVKS